MSHQSAPGSGFVVPNRESRPRDKINSVSTANKVAQSPLIFNLWASTVSLAPPDEVPLDVLPSTLQALVDTSKIIPSWTRNTQASQYSYIPPQFSYQIPAFSGALGASFTTSDDQGLSKDVEDALSLIFQGVKFMTQLRQHPITRLNKADRRLGVNFLASHVWSFSNDESLIHKLECAVQLPHSTASPVEEARPNSAVFFQLKASTLACLPALHFLPYSSMAPRQSSVSGYVLHWVTEYKRDDYAGASKRRAWMAMTSGLYQRRSLGFKDHFVFGTAHDSNTSLTVFAGKWENRAGREQIIIYTLGTFRMDLPTEMLQYFLLVRGARCLALEYQASMDDQAPGLATQIHISQPGINSWVGPKLRRQGRGETTLETRGALSGNTPGTSLDTDGHTQQPVHINVDGPFLRRFAKELRKGGKNAKVWGYLMSSVHDNYDYQVGDS